MKTLYYSLYSPLKRIFDHGSCGFGSLCVRQQVFDRKVGLRIAVLRNHPTLLTARNSSCITQRLKEFTIIFSATSVVSYTFTGSRRGRETVPAVKRQRIPLRCLPLHLHSEYGTILLAIIQAPASFHDGVSCPKHGVPFLRTSACDRSKMTESRQAFPRLHLAVR